MNALFLPNDTLTNKVSVAHLALFVATLPFDQFYSQVVLISFALHTLIHANKKDWKAIMRKEFLLLISVFLITVITTVYTSNKAEAFRLWGRQTAILIFPVLLFVNPVSLKKYTKPLLLLFALVITAVICYLYYDAVRIIRYNHLPISALLTSGFLNHNFSEPIDIHATYLSLYVALALVVNTYYGLLEKEAMRKTFLLLSAIVLLAGLVQLGSRAALISVLVILFFIAPFFLKGKRRWWLLAASLLFVLSLATTVIFIGSFQHRFLQALKEDLSENTSANSVADPRMKRWDVALQLVKTRPLTGYGAGDEVDELMDGYYSNKLYDAYLNKLNAHNQYLGFMLTGGLFALAVYLVTLYFGFRLAFRSKNFVFAAFLVIIAVVSVSENILSRNKGIFFYSFFFTVFVCSECKKKKVVQRQQLRKSTGNLAGPAYVFIDNV